MSIWISSLALLLALAGAAGAQGRDGLRIAAPAGYCIDRNAPAGIVVLGRCTPDVAAPAAVLTAMIGAKGLGAGVEGKALAAFFTSEPGRAALSRRGRAVDVTVLEARSLGPDFLLRLADAGPGGTGSAETWRAVLTLDGRLVTLTASGTAAEPLARDAGRALIEAFVRAMRAANRSVVRQAPVD